MRATIASAAKAASLCGWTVSKIAAATVSAASGVPCRTRSHGITRLPSCPPGADRNGRRCPARCRRADAARPSRRRARAAWPRRAARVRASGRPASGGARRFR